MQETSFDFDILIADDCSTDGTKDILLSYQNKNPNKISLILQPINVYAKNWIDLISAPKTKYVAYVEGDDFWIDNKKLEKQVAFLEANPEYILHCTNAFIYVFEQGSQLPISEWPIKKEDFLTGEISIMKLLYENCIPTMTIVYRNVLQWPLWLKFVPLGDWAWHILNAMHGKIWYSNEITSVYRYHHNSMFSSLTEEKKLKTYIKAWEVLNKNLCFKSNSFFSGHLVRLFKLLKISIKNKLLLRNFILITINVFITFFHWGCFTFNSMFFYENQKRKLHK